MTSLTALTTLQYRVDSLTEQNHKILDSQKEILSLLKRIIGKPTHSVESVIRLRETGTNTPEPVTREQQTQSPTLSDKQVSAALLHNSDTFVKSDGEELENDPIYARAQQGSPQRHTTST